MVNKPLYLLILILALSFSCSVYAKKKFEPETGDAKKAEQKEEDTKKKDVKKADKKTDKKKPEVQEVKKEESKVKEESPRKEEPKDKGAAPKQEKPAQPQPAVKQEAPKQEQPKVQEAPKQEKPAQPQPVVKQEAPKQEQPKVQEAPKQEKVAQPQPAVKQEAPKQEQPKVQEAPKQEKPAQPQPVVKQEAPKQEQPKVQEAPKQEKPAQPQPAVKQEAPKQEQPKVQEAPKQVIESAVFDGLVFDAETKKPLLGAKITTEAFAYPALSTKEGTFKYPMKMKPGTYKLTVELTGYQPVSETLIIPKDIKSYSIKLHLYPAKSPLRSMAEFPDRPFEPVGPRGAEKAFAKEEPVKPVFTFKGRLLDAATSQAIANESVYIKENKLSAKTDAQGEFSLALEPGEYTLIIPIVGFVPLEEKISVKENTNATYQLVEAVVKMEPYGYVQKLAHSNPDNAKFTPGVAQLAPMHRESNGFIIGGAPSYESGFYINGRQVPAAFHLLGQEPVVNPVLIEKTDIWKAGFGAQYFDATGGALNLTLREPRTDRVGGFAELSLLGVSILAEGKFSENDHFFATVRRGMADTFAGMFYKDESGIVYPEYYDTALRYVHNFGSGHELRIWNIGMMDTVGYRTPSMFYDVPVHTNTITPSRFFDLLVAEWDWKNESMGSTLSLSYQNLQESYTTPINRAFDMTAHIIEGREEFTWKINESNIFKAGGSFKLGFFKTDTAFTLLPLEGESGYIFTDTEIASIGYQTYIHPTLWLSHTFVWNGLTIEPGLVFFLDLHSKEEYDMMADPKLALTYAFDPSFKVYLSGGLYSRRPQFDVASETWGTEAIKAEHAGHAALGVEKTFIEKLTLAAGGFFRYNYNLIRRDSTNPLEYLNIGAGYSAGGEMMLSYKSETISGWVGYSFAMSQRKDSEQASWRSADTEIPHTVVLGANWTPSKEWGIYGRFSLRSGAPYSEVTGGVLVDTGTDRFYRPVYATDDSGREVRMGERLGMSHSLDLRGEYNFFLDTMTLTVFGEMQGITGLFDSNAVGKLYSADYTSEGDLSAIPFMATVGIKGEF